MVAGTPGPDIRNGYQINTGGLREQEGEGGRGRRTNQSIVLWDTTNNVIVPLIQHNHVCPYIYMEDDIYIDTRQRSEGINYTTVPDIRWQLREIRIEIASCLSHTDKLFTQCDPSKRNDGISGFGGWKYTMMRSDLR